MSDAVGADSLARFFRLARPRRTQLAVRDLVGRAENQCRVGPTETEQLSASPIAFTEGWVAPAMLVSAGPQITDPGTHGYIVHTTANHYAAALQDAGHQASTFLDDTESHASLAIGFGLEEDAVTQTVGSFLDSLP